MRIDKEVVAAPAGRAFKQGGRAIQSAVAKGAKRKKPALAAETMHAGHASYRIATHAQLVRSALNVRRKSAGGVAELAALIRSQGLLQNLICYEEDGMLHVVAGERRREAIGQLISAGDLPQDFAIACLLVPMDEAVAISLAENSGREAMHPADVFDAMRELAARGAGIEDIALAFGVAPLTVRRRLKLANVAPRFMAMYRADEATFEQLAALAICDDHATQEQVWDSLDKFSRSAFHLRRLLTAQHIDIQQDRLARYVGAAAFEQAGGVIVRDLFSEEEAGYIEDGALLETLARTKLAQLAEPLEDEGWAWIEIQPHADEADLAKYGRVRTVQRELTDAERDAVANLTASIDAVRSEIDELEDGDEDLDDEGHEMIASLHARWDGLDAQLAAVYAGLQVAHADERALSGAIVTISSTGTALIHRNLIHPGDQCQAEKGKGASPKAAATSKVRPVHSEKLVRNLTAQRTVALHAEVMVRPDVALALLVHDLVCRVFHPFQPGCTLAQVSLTMPVLPEEVNDSAAMAAIKARRAELKAMLPADGEAGSLLKWLMAQPQPVLLDLLAFCVGCSLDTIQSRDMPCQRFVALAGAVALDMHGWWQPSAATYLNHVPKSRAVEVVGLALTPEAAQPLLALKKDAASQRAEQLLVGSGWLPELLRT